MQHLVVPAALLSGLLAFVSIYRRRKYRKLGLTDPYKQTIIGSLCVLILLDVVVFASLLR